MRPWRNLLLAVGVLGIRASAANLAPGCDPGATLTIAAVGDVLLHSQLQKQAYQTADGFDSLWHEVTPLLRRADLAYANLEGPAAYALASNLRAPAKDPGVRFDNEAYTGYPVLNYHPIVATALRRAGFAVVSTANNHALDRGAAGVERTIAALDSANLAFTGTRTRDEALDDTDGDSEWHVVTKQKGWRVAWIACTFDTNGFRDRHHLVLDCFRDEERILSELRALHASPSIDAVIVTPHWGKNEYSTKVEPSQAALARRFAEAGATAILGNHPHVTRPWEMLPTSDGRETFVIYSIGNFVSAQSSVPKQASALVYLTLARGDADRKARVQDASYVALWMKRHPYSVVPAEQLPKQGRPAIALLEKLLGKQGRQLASAMLASSPAACPAGRTPAATSLVSVQRAEH